MKPCEVIICDLDHDNIEEERKVLEYHRYTYRWLHCRNQQEVIEQCQGASVLLNQYVRMDRVIFQTLPSVRCIVRYGVGYDNIDLKDAADYGVQICNVPDYGTQEVADHALAHMMNMAREISGADRLIRAGIWDYRRNIPIQRLSECTVGICGVGRIGSAFASRVKALGCRIIAYDTDQNNRRRHFPDFVTFVPFEQLLEESDILSIHCPLNGITYHMFSAEQLHRMKSSALLINVARGGIIDECALYHALKEGQIAGAALDVLEQEPLTPDDPLLSLDNLTITPHTAWYSEAASRDLKRKAAEEAVRFLQQKPVLYSVF